MVVRSPPPGDEERAELSLPDGWILGVVRSKSGVAFSGLLSFSATVIFSVISGRWVDDAREARIRPRKNYG